MNAALLQMGATGASVEEMNDSKGNSFDVNKSHDP